MHIQKGFDTGYNDVGVPLGRAIGELKGAADTLLFAVERRQSKDKTALHSSIPAQSDSAYERLKTFCSELAQIRLADVAEPDWETLEHELRHHSNADPAKAMAQNRAEAAARGDRVDALRARLAALERELLP